MSEGNQRCTDHLRALQWDGASARAQLGNSKDQRAAPCSLFGQNSENTAENEGLPTNCRTSSGQRMSWALFTGIVFAGRIGNEAGDKIK